MIDQPKVFRNWIAGGWVEGDDVSRNVNPSNLDETIGVYARADKAQVERAIAAASEAREGWRSVGILSRSEVLDRVGSELLARKDELGRLLSREEGKTLAEGIGEVARAGHVFKWFAGEALRPGGEFVESVRPGLSVEITREPVGVVGLITPWNFPMAIPAWKIAAALAYGNTVVFKPADAVPASAWALTEIIARSGVPAGVFNLVMGRGGVVGDTIVGHHDIDAVSFTGSQAVGQQLASQLAGRLAKVQLEMGGKNPLIVLDDADLGVAVEVAAQGAYYSTGQRCTASSRLIVTRGIHDAFVEALIGRLQAIQVGDALDPRTVIGPVAEAKQLQSNHDYLDVGKAEGAELVVAGEICESQRGHFMRPALFVGASNDMRIAREEIFGPIACVIRADDYDEAVAFANDTDFGLSSGIVTTSLRHSSDFKRRSSAGMVMVNTPTAGVDFHVPFGGRKQSSYGPREQGHYAAEFYTTVKTAYTAA
ncbi:aldehyde dehydrogenase (NAD+) [Sphingobium xenophagum]|uniref:aldehyde dehydrogenase (NAD(+)) n=1 Tax=Sphingobium xenophagum TaxID=121428 RepID=A0ABU1X4B0_SPHXE|nr:aldehyde dehydrogenase family protein [Sphingobium xenophagum]MDR7156430.1 aldehyde dehydrogenase (NAD+) [Sphingobium xenophagum]